MPIASLAGQFPRLLDIHVSVLKETQRAAYKRLHDIADNLTPKARRAFLDAIDRIKGRASLRQLEEMIVSGRSSEIVRVLGLQNMEADLAGLTDTLRDVYTRAGKEAISSLPKSIQSSARFDLVNPRSVNFLRNHQITLTREVARATREGILEVIRIGFDSGLPPREMAREIMGRIGLLARQQRAVSNFRSMLETEGRSANQVRRMTERFSRRQLRMRAENIARTETINAANAGQQSLWEQAKDSGLIDSKARKKWIVTPDDRLCPICRPIPRMNPQGVPIDGVFDTPVGPRQGPTAHPRCRCATGLLPEGASERTETRQPESGVTVGEGAISANSGKAFNSQIDKLYKKHGVVDWEDDFGASLKMKGYFGNPQSFQINAALRGKGTPTGRVKEILDNLKNGLNSNGIIIPRGSKLYRAVSGDFSKQLLSMKPGSAFMDPGWVSTAGTKAATKRFGKTVMEIRTKNDIKALVYRPETEVLFEPGRTFTIDSVRRSGDTTFISVLMS